MVHTVENRLQLEGLHDEKSVTFRKSSQTVKKTQPDLEKWVTLKNESQSKQWITFGKICHTVKYGINFKKMGNSFTL